MAKPPTVTVEIMRTLIAIGPSLTNEALATAVGSNLTSVKTLVCRMLKRGLLRQRGYGESRRLAVTKAGKDLIAATERKEAERTEAQEQRRLNRSLATVSKPEPIRCYRPPQKRRCLGCGKRFTSTWEGHRVCGGCKSSHEWQSPAVAYTVQGGR